MFPVSPLRQKMYSAMGAYDNTSSVDYTANYTCDFTAQHNNRRAQTDQPFCSRVPLQKLVQVCA